MPIKSVKYSAAREHDAAFFEDWSEWANLDAGVDKSAYWLFANPTRGNLQIYLPTGEVFDRLMSKLGATPHKAHRYKIKTLYWTVEAAKWRALKALLPEIKKAVTAHCDHWRRVRIERDKYYREVIVPKADAVLSKAITEAVTQDRTLAGKIDAITNAAICHPKTLTAWERKFAQNIFDRHEKYGDKIKLSDKQITAIDRIHDKIGGILVV